MINRNTTSFRGRDDIQAPLTPHNKVQDRIDIPAGEWKPASWLPVQFTKSDIHQGEDAFVISSGKVVAFDGEGRLVPAGLRQEMDGAAALVYTSDDVSWKVTDLVTGLPVTAPVTYSSLQVGRALLDRGLVLEADADAASATVPPTTNDQGHDIVELFISRPIGVILYDVYVWSGRPEDGDQKFTNYSKQHLIQFATELQMKVPQLVAGVQESDEFITATLNTAGSATYASGNPVSPGEYWNNANIRQFSRWTSQLSASAPVVALGLDPAGDGTSLRIAKNTVRTPFTCDTEGVLLRERVSPSAISREGDWYLDADLGVLFLHSGTWTTLVAATATINFSYHYYLTEAAAGHKHIHFDGACRPGDFVAHDSASNFRVATAAEVAAGQVIVGRVLEVQRQPRGLLHAVKTGFVANGVSANAQTPGSATGGFTDLITQSPEVVADQIVIVNVRI